MHGLVWEWVRDFNTVTVGTDSRGTGPARRQLYCAAGAEGATDTGTTPPSCATPSAPASRAAPLRPHWGSAAPPTCHETAPTSGPCTDGPASATAPCRRPAACAMALRRPAGRLRRTEPPPCRPTDQGPGPAAHHGARPWPRPRAAHRELAAGEPSDFSIYHADVHLDRPGRAPGRWTPWPAGPGGGHALHQLRLRLPPHHAGHEADRGRARARRATTSASSSSPSTRSGTRPERLAEFAAGSRLDPDRWTLLTAEEGDVLELAALLGVQYRQTCPGSGSTATSSRCSTGTARSSTGSSAWARTPPPPSGSSGRSSGTGGGQTPG
jgi:hypothetical protein